MVNAEYGTAEIWQRLVCWKEIRKMGRRRVQRPIG